MRLKIVFLRLSLVLGLNGLSTTALAQPGPSTSSAAVGLSGFGMPLPGLARADLQLFVTGQFQFTDVDDLPRLGPLFNARSCAGCHFQPALGGSGQTINELRVRDSTTGGPLHIFASDNILRGCPQKQGQAPIFDTGLEASPLGCQITTPGCNLSTCQILEAGVKTFSTNLPICDPTSASFLNGDNCVGERQATPVFGFGLVEAVSDTALQALASLEPSAVRGTVKIVTELGATRVGRFGWKDDHATLRGFSRDAYLNEVGITNFDNPNEISTCALNQVQFGVALDVADDPEDLPDRDCCTTVGPKTCRPPSALHDGQGKLAAQAFQALSKSDRSDLLNFLGSI